MSRLFTNKFWLWPPLPPNQCCKHGKIYWRQSCQPLQHCMVGGGGGRRKFSNDFKKHEDAVECLQCFVQDCRLELHVYSKGPFWKLVSGVNSSKMYCPTTYSATHSHYIFCHIWRLCSEWWVRHTISCEFFGFPINSTEICAARTRFLFLICSHVIFQVVIMQLIGLK